METKQILEALAVNGFELAPEDPCLLLLNMNDVVSECINKPLDIKRLQEILMVRGIRVSINDPLFLVLTLNKILLEDMQKRVRLETKVPPAWSMLMATGPFLCLTGFAGWTILEVDQLPLLQVLISLVLGVTAGIFSTLLYIKLSTTKDLPAVKAVPEKAIPEGLAEGEWSDADFERAVGSLKEPLPPRSLAACRDVLVEGKSVVIAGRNHGVMSPGIMKAKRLIIEAKLKTRC